MRAWAAVAALSLGVLLTGGDMARATPGLKFSYVSARAINKVIDDPKVMHDLKGCESLMPEGVNVVDASPKIRHFVSVPENCPICPNDGHFVKVHSHARLTAGANYVRPLLRTVRGKLQNFIGFQFATESLFECYNDIIGGRLSRVPEIDNRLPIGYIARRLCKLNACGMDIGSQLAFAGPFSVQQRPFGYAPKPNCGNCENDSEQSGNTGPVAIDENASAPPTNPEESADTFFKGLMGWGCVVCLYALLKKLGTKYYPDNYR